MVGHSAAPEDGNGHAISRWGCPNRAREESACNGPASLEGCRQALKTTWRRSQCPPDASFAERRAWSRGAAWMSVTWQWGRKDPACCRAGPGGKNLAPRRDSVIRE